VTNRAEYLAFLLPVLLFIPFSKSANLLKLGSFAVLFLVMFIFTISLAQTKIFWYDTPVFPFLAIALTCGIYIVYKGIRDRWRMAAAALFLGAVMLFILYFPYAQNIHQVIKNDNFEWEGKEFYEPSNLFRRAIKGEVQLNETILLYNDKYKPHLNIYIKQLEEKQGNVIKSKRYLEETKPGDRLIYFQPWTYADSLKTHYPYQLIKKEGDYIQIIERLPKNQ
jgi:hypothetical protein